MIGHINIRTKVILGVVFFTLILFGLIQHQHDNTIKQQFIQSEEAKNTLLIETVIPVLSLNLAFGLDDASALYLDGIAAKNLNIISLSLKTSEETTAYFYKNPKYYPLKELSNYTTIKRTIHDSATATPMGTIEVLFSNIYYDRYMKEHREFTRQFVVVLLILLILFIYFLNRAFAPLKSLQGEVEKFEPQNNNFQFNVSTQYNEVGIIQDALVNMIERINLYTRELDELNRHLEQKVLERTHTLKDQKEQLEQVNSALKSKIAKVQEQEKMLISQSRLAAMGEMSSMIAHQWRQPLATTTLMISNYAIKSMINQAERDERDEILQNVSDTLIYLSDTIDDFQTYFKPENKTEEANLCDIIQRSVQFTQTRLTLHNISIKTECDECLTVETYINELTQVLINIINNAIDAIVESDMENKIISIKNCEDDKYVILSIEDSGGGIPEEVMPRIFEPYFSTKSKNGTGLGLYMAKMIIDKHIEGKISAENTEEGTVFSIYFPKSSRCGDC